MTQDSEDEISESVTYIDNVATRTWVWDCVVFVPLKLIAGMRTNHTFHSEYILYPTVRSQHKIMSLVSRNTKFGGVNVYACMGRRSLACLRSCSGCVLYCETSPTLLTTIGGYSYDVTGPPLCHWPSCAWCNWPSAPSSPIRGSFFPPNFKVTRTLRSTAMLLPWKACQYLLLLTFWYCESFI